MTTEHEWDKILAMVNTLNDDDRRDMLALLAALQVFIRQDPQETNISPVPYYQFINAIIQHPEQGWLLDHLAQKIKESEEARGKAGSSTRQGQQSLKMRPPVKTKMDRLEQTIDFLQHRRTKLQQLAQNNARQRKTPLTPQMIAALDAFLDLVTSFFAEPTPKKSIRPGASLSQRSFERGE